MAGDASVSAERFRASRRCVRKDSERLGAHFSTRRARDARAGVRRTFDARVRAVGMRADDARGGARARRVFVDARTGGTLSVVTVDDDISSSPSSARARDREYEIVMRYSAFRAFRWRALALGMMFAWRALVGTSSVAAVVFLGLACALTLGTRAHEARLVRDIGVCIETVSWFGGRRSVLIPSEDIEAFATREAVSTTDVWFQILCIRTRDKAPMVLFADFRCSAVWAAAVLDAAQKCFDCVE